MLPPTTGARPKILVADDDDLLSEVLVSALTAYGYGAVQAPGGVLTAELLDDAALVILDANIPGVNFDSTLRALDAQAIGVLVITGETTPPTGVPVERYVGKPVDLAELLAAVGRLTTASMDA
jgi:DNA-binding response OmpR family regulator